MESGTQLRRGLEFLRARIWLVSAMSVLLLIPCWWHRRIEAGDLASHVYNAWLGQLIAKGQAPGLYLSTQWNNVLFDIALVKSAYLVGLPGAEKIVVSACLLIFFWGAFALLAAVTQRAPWSLAPCLAMLAYGPGPHSLNMELSSWKMSWSRAESAEREGRIRITTTVCVGPLKFRALTFDSALARAEREAGQQQ